jgi:hypothetical protein
MVPHAQMTSLTSSSENPILWLVGAAVVVIVVWSIFRDRKRQMAVQEYARIHQIQYLGKTAPTTFHVERLSVWRPSDEVKNLSCCGFAGYLGGPSSAL